MECNNTVYLCGRLAGRPEFSHMGGNDRYYTFPLEIERLSGTADIINIVARQDIMERMTVTDGQRIAVSGELRSFNNKSGTGSKLVISVFAREMEFTEEPDENKVTLSGTLCKKPNLRRTPMGRQICDMMLAVSRRYGRSDYLPVISWGRFAQEASELEVGDRISLDGRIQSRRYIKKEDGVAIEKTAFEVSVVEMQSET